MAIVRFKISTARDLPKGNRTIAASKLEAVNGRLKLVMLPVVRANQKKQQKSLEKISKTVLNA